MKNNAEGRGDPMGAERARQLAKAIHVLQARETGG
jgi:hypothetical protein